MRSLLRAPIVRGSAALVGTTGITSAAGFAFWMLAAHAWDVADVGTGATVVAAMTVIALLASQPVATTLLGRLARSSDRRGAASAGLALSTVAAGLCASGTVVLLPRLSPSLAVLDDPGIAAVFVVGCAAQAAGMVLDATALALRVSKVLLLRNSVHSGGKLALLALLGLTASSTWSATAALLCSWTVMSIVTALGSLRRLARVLPRTPDALPMTANLRRLGEGSLAQTLATLCGAVPPQLLPVLVAIRCDTRAAGVFALTWQLATACFTISPSVSSALLAEGAHEPETLSARVRLAVKLVACLMSAPVVVFVIAGSTVLDVFGASYAAAGTGLLALLAISSFPDAVTNLANAVWRVREQLWPPVAVNVVIAVVTTAGAWLLLPTLGLAGGGVAWTAAQCAGCLVVLAVHKGRPSAPVCRRAIALPASAVPTR